jgi:hypothetical protein
VRERFVAMLASVSIHGSLSGKVTNASIAAESHGPAISFRIFSYMRKLDLRRAKGRQLVDRFVMIDAFTLSREVI